MHSVSSACTQKLVSPQGILYLVDDRHVLVELVNRLQLNYKLAGNLRQLCQYDRVGTDRKQRYDAAGWKLLHTIPWLRRDGCNERIPVVGKVDDFYINIVQKRDDMTFALSTFKKLLPSKEGNQCKHVVQQWRVVQTPCGLSELTDGSNLFDFGTQVCLMQRL